METIDTATAIRSLKNRFRDKLYGRWLFLYVFLLTLGVLGDLVSCMPVGLPIFWAQIAPQWHYIGIVFVATRLGAAFGLASACLAAILHMVVITMTCSQASSQSGHLAMFAAIGLTAGLIAKRNAPAVSRDSESTNRGRNLSMSELGRMMPELVHQFRTPIASIEGAGFVLEDADLSEEKRQEFVAIVRKECRRLELLVELLDFTQSRASTSQEVDVARLLDEVIGLCRPEINAGIQLRNTARRDLPRLRCDPTLIREAVHALTMNAIQAIAQNGELELSAGLTTGEIVIWVDAYAEHFDVPLDPAMTYKSSGIDLAVVQQIVGRRGGSVRIEPSPRGDIRFSMALPRTSG